MSRLFLNGVSKAMVSSELKERLETLFRPFGTVTEVFIPSRTDKHYAFISFFESEAAEHVLEQSESLVHPELFDNIQPAEAPRNKHQKRVDDEWKNKLKLCQKSNIMCQVHHSHLERLDDFIAASDNGSIIVGSITTNSTSISLLLINTQDHTLFVQWLEKHSFASSAVNQLYLVQSNDIRGQVETQVTSKALDLLRSLSPGPAAVRLCMFPPKLQSAFLQSVQGKWDENDEKLKNIQLDPRDYTHKLSIVQVDSTGGPDEQGGLFCMGITARIPIIPMTENPNADANDDNHDICRAYHKLKEAFVRYDFQGPQGSDMVALDCGAAPGGWTKYLTKHFDCQKVYSVDPGMLSPSVTRLPVVEHVAARIEDFLPMLQAKGVLLDIWVSDMCLKDMSYQVTCMLAARDMAVLRKGLFFVLTLKCTLGHAKSTFDRQVAEEVVRLKEHNLVRDLQIIHLFANRIGERTIMGYLD
jgi:23S rRNA U2552 (ribose-2'-O)-methylase RlmE/FtsJ